MHIFTDDTQMINLVVKLLIVDVFLEFGRVTNLVYGQALKTSGDALFPVILGAIFMYLFAVLFYTTIFFSLFQDGKSFSFMYNFFVVTGHGMTSNTLRDAQKSCIRMISRCNSRVFCELCSQKTPRGMLPVNSNLKSSYLYVKNSNANIP